MRFTKIASIAVATAFLGACGTLDALHELEQTTPTGTPFTEALAKEYRDFAAYEAYDMEDWPDQEYFAKKGLRAAKGEVVAPETLNDWNLPKHAMLDLTKARTNLVVALDGSGRSKAPAKAALAQAKFDCWVEQQEENHQPDHIEACRKDFEAAIVALKEAMKPEPMEEEEAAPEPEPQITEPLAFRIYFDFDSVRIGDAGRNTVNEIVEASTMVPGEPVVSVVGHADRAGSDDYNEQLSKMRAGTVRTALRQAGYNGEIRSAYKGETKPQVMTPDGVREQENRRVAVVLFWTGD